MAQEGSALRCFVAIKLDDSARIVLDRVQRKLCHFDGIVRWSTTANVHLTLKFLGDLPDREAPAVCEAAARAAGQSAPLAFRISGLGCFPPGGLVRVLWAGVHSDGEELKSCQEALEREMEELGFRPEARAWSPHLTIGRVRPGAGDTTELRAALGDFDLVGPMQKPRNLIVFQSTRTPKGPVHVIVARCPIGKNRTSN